MSPNFSCMKTANVEAISSRVALPVSASDQDVFWMQRVAKGDMEALQSLIEAHQARVVGTVVKMLGDDLDAEDIAQQVFIRVWKSAGRYQPTAKFTTWLFKITRNLSLMNCGAGSAIRSRRYSTRRRSTFPTGG